MGKNKKTDEEEEDDDEDDDKKKKDKGKGLKGEAGARWVSPKP